MANLTTAQASKRLGIPESTLRYWRHIQTGPPSFRLGHRVFYRTEDIEAWEDEQYHNTRSPQTAR